MHHYIPTHVTESIQCILESPRGPLFRLEPLTGDKQPQLSGSSIKNLGETVRGRGMHPSLHALIGAPLFELHLISRFLTCRIYVIKKRIDCAGGP